MDSIANYTAKFMNLLKDHPLASYLIIPENDLDIQAFDTDYQRYKEKIDNGSIYDEQFENLNDFSWFYIEYIQYTKNRNIYHKFFNQIHKVKYNKREYYTIVKYLNSPINKKKEAEAKVFHRDIRKKTPKDYDLSRSDLLKRESKYPESKQTSTEFFDFVKKHPFFSHIYFSKMRNKAAFYKQVMEMYDRLATDCHTASDVIYMAKNLRANALPLKKTMNSIMVFDLYVNKYKKRIMHAYQDQFYDNNFFFQRLWKPYYHDFIVNRMGTEMSKVLSARNWNKSYKRFLVQWSKLGDFLRNMMKSILKSFKVTTGVREPQPENV
jgi:hypothetical protein